MHASLRPHLVCCSLLSLILLSACGSGSATPDDAAADAADITDAGDAAPSEADADAPPMPDAAQDAGSDAAPVGDAGDAGLDADVGLSAVLCPPADRVANGYTDTGGSAEVVAGLCDGLDNNDDGLVDEGCPCETGEVQLCFAGPPGRANVGACSMGTQVCQGFEFPTWGACEGGVRPKEEVCDSLDNNCNGCTDELDECVNLVECPAPGDTRIGEGNPFASFRLDADKFVEPKNVKAYRWRVQGSPCDRLHASLPNSPATSENGKLSYTLKEADTASPSIDFTLSGEYLVTMEVDLINNETVACEFPVPVKARGLRVELCWDESGPSVGSEVDLDLRIAKQGTTTEWLSEAGNDCGQPHCGNVSQIISGASSLWGHPRSGVAGCTGPGVADILNDMLTGCYNPRLDLDSSNVPNTEYPTENVNHDNPRTGDSYRVAVHHYTTSARVAHPLVNVYCNGDLAGSYRLAPGEFDTFGKNTQQDLWRVVDVATTSTAGVTGCELTPLTAADGLSPWITQGDVTY